MKTATAITPTAEPAEILPMPLQPPAPVPEASWERARQLWQSATRGADAIIELGRILLRLREQFFGHGQGARTDIQHPSARGRRSENSHDQECVPRTETGWQQTVQRELGITKQTALRLIERADALQRLQLLSEGTPVRWRDARGTIRVTEPTPENQTLAQQAIPDVVAGLMNPRRAWAGVCGEAARVEMGKQRADVDHAGVMLRAIRSVKAALRKWDELPPQDRIEVEAAWMDLLGHVPSTWTAPLRRAK